MAWFFKKKKQEMEIPPPPPPDEAEKKEIKKDKPPGLPPLPEKHLPSELPEIKPAPKEKEELPPMPEFPEIPEEAKEVKKEEVIEKPVLPEEIAKPRFVKIAGFQTVLTKADEIRSSLKKAENVILRLSELKNEEEKEFQKWRTQLEDTEKKLSYVDQVIFKGE